MVQVQSLWMMPQRVGTTMITPCIQWLHIRGARQSHLVLGGNNKVQIDRLRASGVFRLPIDVNYVADVFLNSSITPRDWFMAHNTDRDTARVMEDYGRSQTIIGTNAGNAPLHDFEANYAAAQCTPLACKDFETANRPISRRRYYSVSHSPIRGIQMGYVRFGNDGKPIHADGVDVAVSGWPLVHQSQPVPLSEVMTTSLTDPRHVVHLPEIALQDPGNPQGVVQMPLGLRTLQRFIREERAEEIVQRIRDGVPLLIDLDEESGCWGGRDVTTGNLTETLYAHGYAPADYDLSDGSLYLKLRLNAYRHTFWAQRGDDLFIGIIGNDLDNHDGRFDDFAYQRVLKPVGLTIPDLQNFLTQTLRAEEAVLMGNGRDVRMYLSESPRDAAGLQRFADTDIRPDITAGMVFVVR